MIKSNQCRYRLQKSSAKRNKSKRCDDILRQNAAHTFRLTDVFKSVCVKLLAMQLCNYV